MAESPVSIILDGDMLAYSKKTALENTASFNPTQNLPPLPLWSCMVDGTLNFCRLIWELYQDSKISVTVAGDRPTSLIDWHQPNYHFEQLIYNFQRYRPTESNHPDHFLETFKSSFHQLLLPKPDSKVKLKTGRIVFMTISKGLDEDGYRYRVKSDGSLKDMRAMLYKAFPRDRMNGCVTDIHIDIFRIVPTSVPEHIPLDILNEQITPGLTFSIYNIPNGKYDLTRAIVHLAQLHFNIGCLQICEKSNQIESAEYYYATPTKNKQPNPFIRIYDTRFSADMTQQGIILKKERDSLSDLNVDWRTPLHTGTFLKQKMNEYTNKLRTELHNGIHLYILSKTEMGTKIANDVLNQDELWNRVLLYYKGRLVIQDVDHDLSRSSIPHDNITVKQEIKQEFNHQLLSIPNITHTIKAKEFIDKLVRPNTYQDVVDFMKQAAATENQTALTADYNTQLFGLSHTQTKLSKCALSMERQTKFQTCLRDGQAYASLDFDLQHLELCRSPAASAFGISPQGLIGGMFEELEEALVNGDDTKGDTSMKNLVDMMVVELFNAKRNKPSQRLFPKSAGKDQIKLLATKSLVALYLVGTRFKNDSSRHRTICQRILDDITVQIEWNEAPPSDDANEVTNGNNKRHSGVDAAWGQAKRYKSMTHREKEDARMHDIPSAPQPQQHQQQTSVNPLFRGRRHAPDANTANSSRTYPDPSIAIPYLHIPAPETKADDVNPGPPNSLLAQFWSAHQHRMKTTKDFDGRKLRYQLSD